MTPGIRIVAPFKPFPPESDLHLALADFDWIAALGMLRHSARLACQCPVHIITDLDTVLPVPTLHYATTERRLMLWALDACLQYLQSDDFDRNTVMLDVDQLIYKDLAPWFSETADLAVLIRPTEKHQRADGQPLLNGVQWWAIRGKTRLIALYQHVLAIARGLPEDRLRWGADTDALHLALAPLGLGLHLRHGVRVQMIDAATVLEALSENQIRWLRDGRLPRPTRAVLDFRWKRKPHMRAVYEATILSTAGAAPCR